MFRNSKPDPKPEKQPKNKVYKLKPRSKTMTKKMRIYGEIAKKFLKENKRCQVEGCIWQASEVHHRKGRLVHLFDVSTFLAVCRDCHRKIEENPEWAKENKYSESRLAMTDYEKKVKENNRPFKGSEDNLVKQVVGYLKAQYPGVYFRIDAAAGMRLTIGQATKNKNIQKCRAWPDLFIAQPSKGKCGLFLELKRDRDQVYNKNGTLKKDEHVQEQADMLEILRSIGYEAEFGMGFDHCKQLIDNYLNHL